MSRRGRSDVVVVGGGVVGAACALALAKLGLEVALVEGREPARWSADAPDLRVYAFAPDNAALLDGLGVWESVRSARAQAYRRMRVWDASGGGELSFDADLLGRDQLGWIIENNLLVDRLWAALPAAGVQLHCPARVESMEQDEQRRAPAPGRWQPPGVAARDRRRWRRFHAARTGRAAGFHPRLPAARGGGFRRNGRVERSDGMAAFPAGRAARVPAFHRGSQFDRLDPA